MKKIRYTLSCMFFTCSFVFSQIAIKPSWELGVFGGVSYYLGELNQTHFKGVLPNEALNGNNSFMPDLGLVYRYNFTGGRVSWKSSFIRARIEAFDALSSNQYNETRGLGFTSQLHELSTQVEINYFTLDPTSSDKIFSPFVYTGLSVLWMDPKFSYGGSGFTSLQPLSTEGVSYSKTQLVIPLGVGIKWQATRRITISADWGIRKTFTDYIDDVSTVYVPADELAGPNNENANAVNFAYQNLDRDELAGRQRGNSSKNDWYNFTGITISWLFQADRDICPSFIGY